MSLPRVSEAYRWLAEDDRGTPAAVEEMLKLLGKASRAHQLYLANNPTYHRALDLLRRSFEPVWAQTPELTLTVTECALLFDGRPVFQEAERASDTLPWLLFKDGVRELRLLPGFETTEVEALLSVLGQLRRAAASEDDAITLLWERDFSFLRYRYVEPFGDDEIGSFSIAPTPGRLSGAELPDESEPPRPAAVVRMEEFDGTLHFLTERELSYLHDALAQEYGHDLRRDIADQLLDTVELTHDPAARSEMAEALEELLVHAMAAGDYRAAAHLLAETTVTLGRATQLEQEQIRQLGALAEQLSADGPLSQMIELLESADVPASDADLQLLFAQLRPGALETLLRWVERVRSARLRSALRTAADRLALESSAELLRLIGSTEGAVAREAVRCASELRIAAAVPALTSLLRRGDGPLAVLAAKALAELATHGALDALAGFVDSPDRELRLLALRAVGQRGFRGALPRVDALVRDRRLRERDLTEQMAAFEAYGSLCGDDGIPLLDGLLNGRSLLGRRQEPPLRACAAVALGVIGSDRARQSLVRAGDEKEAVVRNAVQRALRGRRP